MTHFIYRFLAVDGSLLYVGRTARLLNRMRNHRCSTPWWHEVVSVQIDNTTYGDAASASVAECHAIMAGHPKYNIVPRGDNEDLLPAQLRRLRKKANLTHTDLGALLGVSSRTVDRWETGETPITTIHEMAIRSVLNRAGTRQEAAK
jgi:DNA-binding transcriptional regulator YiaG